MSLHTALTQTKQQTNLWSERDPFPFPDLGCSSQTQQLLCVTRHDTEQPQQRSWSGPSSHNSPLSWRKKTVTSTFSKFYCTAFLPLQPSTWKRTSSRAPVQSLISQRSCSTKHSLSRFQVKIKQVAELQPKPFTQPDKTL